MRSVQQVRAELMRSFSLVKANPAPTEAIATESYSENCDATSAVVFTRIARRAATLTVSSRHSRTEAGRFLIC